MFWSPHDAAQYFSAMRQGTETSSWLVYNRFTEEPHVPALMYTLYVGIGKLSGLLGIEFDEAFMAAGSAGRLFLCLAAYAFAGIVSRDTTTRRAALIVVTLSTGFSSVLAIISLMTGLPMPLNSRELNDPELNTFLTFFTAPHLMFGLGLLLIAARLVADCWEHGGWGRRAALALVVVTLGFINPFSLVPLCLIVGAHAVFMTGWQRRVDFCGWSAVFAVGLPSLPFMLYSALAFTGDSFWGATYGAQNVTLTPPVADVLWAFGVLIPLAMLGLRQYLRQLTTGRVLVLLWIVLAVVLMYSPIGIQRRFGIGLHPLLSLVATFGLLMVWRKIRGLSGSVRLLRPFATVGLAQALFGSSAHMYAVGLSIALMPPLFHSPDLVGPGSDRSSYQQVSLHEAAEWLAPRVGPDDLILSATLTGNFLAGAVPARSYVGHWVATLDYPEKKRLAEWFFSKPLDAERREFLAQRGVRYVLYGRNERLLRAEPAADGDIAADSAMAVASGVDVILVASFGDGETTVYAVRPRG
jgi:hypothetical protein